MLKTSYRIGIFSEKLAILYLILKGYKILKNRYAGIKGSKYGEIDLIAQKNNTIIFIEVKNRYKKQDAYESITERQQQRIANSAEVFISKNYKKIGNMNFRFDCIIIWGKLIPHINHIKNSGIKS